MSELNTSGINMLSEFWIDGKTHDIFLMASLPPMVIASFYFFPLIFWDQTQSNKGGSGVETGDNRGWKTNVIGNRLLSINTNQWTEAKTGNRFPGAGSMRAKKPTQWFIVFCHSWMRKIGHKNPEGREETDNVRLQRSCRSPHIT